MKKIIIETIEKKAKTEEESPQNFEVILAVPRPTRVCLTFFSTSLSPFETFFSLYETAQVSELLWFLYENSLSTCLIWGIWILTVVFFARRAKAHCYASSATEESWLPGSATEAAWYKVPVYKQGSGTSIAVFNTSLCAWLGSYMTPPFSVFLFPFPDICSQFFFLLVYLRDQLGVSGHFMRHEGYL